MRRRSLLFILKIAVSAGLIALVGNGLEEDALRAALAALRPLVIFEVLFLLSLQPLFLAWRWRRVLGLLGAPLPRREAVRLTFIGLFFNQVLPSSFGGDAVKIWGAWRLGIDGVTAAAATLIDRASGLVTCALLIAAALALVGPAFENAQLRGLLFSLAPLGIAAMLVIAYADRLTVRWLPRSLRHSVAKFAGGFRCVITQPGPLAWLFFLGVLSWLPYFLAVDMMASSLAVDLGLPAAVIVAGGSLLIGALPVSVGGWGVRELAMVTLFAAFGQSAEVAVLVSVTVAALAAAVALPGGLLWWTLRRAFPTKDRGLDDL
jgi:uncharacterized protein (TIRG00374 family)